MEKFRRVVLDCDLTDLGFSRAWYTWERGNFSSNNIRERLDRGFANDAWMICFPNWNLQHLTHSISDRSPIFIKLEVDSMPLRTKQFRFEA